VKDNLYVAPDNTVTKCLYLFLYGDMRTVLRRCWLRIWLALKDCFNNQLKFAGGLSEHTLASQVNSDDELISFQLLMVFPLPAPSACAVP